MEEKKIPQRGIKIMETENGYLFGELRQKPRHYSKDQLDAMITRVKEIINEWDVEEIDEEDEE